MPSRAEWLESYEYPIEAEKDFSIAGVPASWASGHPQEWITEAPGKQEHSFPLPENMMKGENAYISMHSAMSSDQKLLAISTSNNKVVVYDVETKELRQELDGAGKLHFRPVIRKDGQEGGDDVGDGKEEDDFDKPSYTLISSASYDGDRGANPNTLILWDLDKNGHLLVEEEPIDASAFASQALASISSDLEAKHEWSKEFITSSSLLADFEKALSKVSIEHRRRHNTILADARLGNFGSLPFSADGKYLLYSTHNKTTQNGMREPDELPQTIVWDVDASKEVLRLRGHTDYITWSSFSRDGKYVASISWDSTMRMYSASTGKLAWATGESGGQAWSGAFSPDSKYIVWSSNKGSDIKVHDVATGDLVSEFRETFRNWCRCLVWHPDSQQIALCVDRHAYIWCPFKKGFGGSGTVAHHFEMKKHDERRGFDGVSKVRWLQEGKKLGLSMSDGTSLIWDTETNAKEIFIRPKGAQVAWSDEGLYYTVQGDEDHDFYISVDGDGLVRYWRCSVPAFPSWWDKEETKPDTAAFPSTGKYVKITKAEDAERDQWVEKGAGIWTAE